MAAAKGASLNHISRESSDIKRLAQFYIEIFGFEQVESPKLDFNVLWLKLAPSFYLHLIERDPSTKLPEGPWSANSAVADPKNLPRGHHICFSVSNFDSFVQILKSFDGRLKEAMQASYTLVQLAIELNKRKATYKLNSACNFVKHLNHDKGISIHEKSQPDGKTKQVFFFDPDGNGLEVSGRTAD